jgi:hypothetical protein
MKENDLVKNNHCITKFNLVSLIKKIAGVKNKSTRHPSAK